jgi:hypothetical protein
MAYLTMLYLGLQITVTARLRKELCFLAVKRSGREADHLPLSNAEVKHDEAIPPLSHTPPWLGAYRDNFTFTFSLRLFVEREASLLQLQFPLQRNTPYISSRSSGV